MGRKRSLDFIIGCEYIIESFGGLHNKNIFIALLSVIIDNIWKPVSSKPIIIFLTVSNKFLAWIFSWHNMNNILTLWEYTAKHKSKSTCYSFIAVVRLVNNITPTPPLYNQNKVSGEFHQQQVKILWCLSVQVTWIYFNIHRNIIMLINQRIHICW